MTRFVIFTPLAIGALCALNFGCAQAQPAPAAAPATQLATKTPILHRAFARIEASFALPNLTGDPFDYTANDVRVQIETPGGQTVSLPAFFDGGNTWRVRHTPDAPGSYRVVAVARNGAPTGAVAAPAQWNVTAQTQVPGFINLDPANAKRLARDENGRAVRYFPLGHNVAWGSSELPAIPQMFGKMNAAGENWSRVWMTHWDGKNLDWMPDNKLAGPLGTLSLEAARRWDEVVAGAEKSDVPFQMVLQHHGQYSTRVNPNWDENPYNAKNGGFLQTPDEFFTNAQAKSLTKRKLRYAVARWGYSPAIGAWELFNEVQFTDAANDKHWDTIAAWHHEMRDFLRAQDVYGHLITTSSTGDFPADASADLDYAQEHLYPSDVISALHASHARARDAGQPVFVGEFGPEKVSDPQGIALHAGLWAGLMSGDAGAPQFWGWDDVEKNDLYGQFAAATGFVKASGLAAHDDLSAVAPVVETAARTDLSFGPGGGWGEVTQNEFEITSAGAPPAMAKLPAYLQGENNRNLMPKPLVFRVNYAGPGQFRVFFSQVSQNGAHPKLSVDGGPGVEADFPKAAKDYNPPEDQRVLAVDVPAGAHTLTLENSGQDWANIEKFVLTDYASSLGAYGLASPSYFVGWIFSRGNIGRQLSDANGATPGRMAVTGLKPGNYRATWWDTAAGRAIRSDEVKVSAQTPAPVLTTPDVKRDVSVFVRAE